MSDFQIIVAFTAAVALIPATWIPLHIFRTTRFNAAAAEFHKVLIPTMQALDNPKSSLKEIIITEFTNHEAGMLRITRILKFERNRRDRFNEKWTEYKEIANEYLDYEHNTDLQFVEYLLNLTKDSEFIKGLRPTERDKFTADMTSILKTEDIRKKHIRSLLENLCDITTKY